MTTSPARDVELASDLVVHAARLVRAVRRELELPAIVRIVSLLDEHGPVGISRLAELDRCSQPTMSSAVAQLVDRGWATKAPNPDDARGSVVTLTDAGRAELARIRRLNGERVAALVADHPDLDNEDLATAVAVLRGVLQKGSTS
ncbi:MarR family winged helix-turn-helix transcriptional regulator [Nocardioides sp. YIM 152315]|uniref:MarR family winged helix-turn-helix transcriptional regulator n=1 Tax=Nocardioides sp. YIM 152315 TaxID=3031760 RepID=UPI0023D9F14A|nr:MarR family winged helix-turn-helix transcriptional regulator [Nocardioides sp. YIM 152315]MDF1606456.1 MarR family winged helix-turn-helix transcriptional regulator [Nocardioides sp. YIM 152315]